jgi:indole-3-glycerol phosphate synthase
LATPAQDFPLICEVKRASPSAGPLKPSANAAEQAKAYAAGGARCISVLTEEQRFFGSIVDLEAVRQAVQLPILRKDFIVDTYMVHEAAHFGADAVLLIAGALPPSQLAGLAACAQELGLDVLLELVHERELEVLAYVSTPLVGVNARDLETLDVDPTRFARLAPRLAAQGRLLVAESGVRTPADVRTYAQLGARAALIGEALMRAEDPTALIRDLAGALK